MPKTLRSPEQTAFQQLMRDARKEAGLTQVDLAARLERPQSFVAKYENGERRIDVIEFVGISTALGLSPKSLFDRLLERMP
jgi:transcriptional regulator with XRE-family HTH domain